jgi:3-hydroxyisobutyrate dehydrogenase
MGAAVATNLRRSGHDVRVHDVDSRAAEVLTAMGASWATSPAEAAADAEAIFTCLPGPPEVEAVALAPNGLQSAMRAGSTWFDLTTNSPELVRRLHATFGAREVSVLDAPISGGPHGAQSRRLAIWVGGDEAAYNRFLPVLKQIGDEPVYLGPIGSGCVAKLIHNCASFTIQGALAEIFTLGVKAGVDPLLLFKALRQGTTGRSRTFDRLAEHFLPNDYDPPKFALRLAYKDMSLALALAASHKVAMPSATIAMQDIQEALQRGWGDRDARIPMALQPERAGVSVQIPRDKLEILAEASLSAREPVSAMQTKFEEWV